MVGNCITRLPQQHFCVVQTQVARYNFCQDWITRKSNATLQAKKTTYLELIIPATMKLNREKSVGIDGGKLQSAGSKAAGLKISQTKSPSVERLGLGVWWYSVYDRTMRCCGQRVSLQVSENLRSLDSSKHTGIFRAFDFLRSAVRSPVSLSN